MTLQVDTNSIRRQLLRITQKYTDKRLQKLADDVMDLCDAYDNATGLQAAVQLEKVQSAHALNLLATLKQVQGNG